MYLVKYFLTGLFKLWSIHFNLDNFIPEPLEANDLTDMQVWEPLQENYGAISLHSRKQPQAIDTSCVLRLSAEVLPLDTVNL